MNVIFCVAQDLRKVFDNVVVRLLDDNSQNLVSALNAAYNVSRTEHSTGSPTCVMVYAYLYPFV